MGCIPDPMMPNAVKATTPTVPITTKILTLDTILRTATEGNIKTPIARDSCKAISRDFNNTEATTVTETTAAGGLGKNCARTEQFASDCLNGNAAIQKSRHFSETCFCFYLVLPDTLLLRIADAVISRLPLLAYRKTNWRPTLSIVTRPLSVHLCWP